MPRATRTFEVELALRLGSALPDRGLEQFHAALCVLRNAVSEVDAAQAA